MRHHVQKIVCIPTKWSLRLCVIHHVLMLVLKARLGEIDPVFGRDDEIRQMVDILSRRRKNNPILEVKVLIVVVVFHLMSLKARVHLIVLMLDGESLS